MSDGSSSSCTSCSGGLRSTSDAGTERLQKIIYPTFTKEFRYDTEGRVSEEIYVFDGGGTYSVSYSSNNELREIRIPGLGSITISDYQWNRPTTVRYPGGSMREYEYDALMRLTRLVARDPGGNPILDYSYGYDGASRLTSVENPALDDESYSYDVVGNRQSAPNVTGDIIS